MTLRPISIVLTLLFLILSTGLSAQESKPPVAIGQPDSQTSSSSENWQELSVHASKLESRAPITGQGDKFEHFTRELIRVQWRDGDPIDLYIVRPVGKDKPPVILYQYGYPREAVRFLDPAFCETITKGGYAAVGFSSRLTGQRYHDVPMKEWFVSDLHRSLIGTVHDVQMVIDYLDEQNSFDMSRLGFFGEGSGATIAILAASVDPRIKAVDLLNPWGDWPDWTATSHVIPDRERGEYLQPDFLATVAPLDPVRVLPKLGQIPVRLQQTLWDTSEVSGEARRMIAGSLPANGVLAQYKDQKDYLEQVGRNGNMLDWIYQALQKKEPSATQVSASH